MHDLEKESVAQGVNYIITALEIIARLAQDPKTCREVADEEAALWTVKNHAEWICSYIKEKRDAETILRVVQ